MKLDHWHILWVKVCEGDLHCAADQSVWHECLSAAGVAVSHQTCVCECVCVWSGRCVLQPVITEQSERSDTAICLQSTAHTAPPAPSGDAHTHLFKGATLYTLLHLLQIQIKVIWTQKNHSISFCMTTLTLHLTLKTTGCFCYWTSICKWPPLWLANACIFTHFWSYKH